MGGEGYGFKIEGRPTEANSVGRWPSHLIHDGSEEVVALFPADAGAFAPVGPEYGPKSSVNVYGDYGPRKQTILYDSGGTAARFFYCAKPSQAERNGGLEGMEGRQQDESRKDGNPGGDNPRNRGVNERRNFHPTVKPLALMEYLVRLITPPNGMVYDPFAGSGTTCLACIRQGFHFIASEAEAEYCAIAQKRINAERAQTKLAL